MRLGAMIYSFAPAIRSGQMTQRDAVDLCARLGLSCVDTMHGLGGNPWADVRKMVEDAGMFVACHITMADLATLDDAARHKGMDALRASIADTANLGADKLMVVTGRIPEGCNRATAQRRVGEALAAMAPEARAAGVRLCIEDFPGDQSPHRTSAEVLEVCEIAGPQLGVCFDTGNFYTGGEGPQEAWPRLALRVIHAHVKDWAWAADGRHSTPDGKRFNPELVGRGIIEYPALLAQMKASGYNGVLSYEYEGPMDRAQAARQGIAYMRSVLELTL